MLHRRLKGVRSTELGVDDNEPNSPVDLAVFDQRRLLYFMTQASVL